MADYDYLGLRLAAAHRALSLAIRSGNSDMIAARQRDLASIKTAFEEANASTHRKDQDNHRKRING